MPATSTQNFPGSLTPTYGGKTMPYTEKQTRFFQAVAHGMRPTRTDSKLTPGKAKDLLSHEDKKVKSRQRGQDRAFARL